MRCDEARRRLRADAFDPEASGHLEDCAACFPALEAADPLVGRLRAARPARAVMARGAGSRAPLATIAALAAVAIVAAAAELRLGIRPTVLAPAVAALPDALAGALAALVAVRSALLDTPGLLTGLTGVTAAVCALWLRLALRVPAWRSAR